MHRRALEFTIALTAGVLLMSAGLWWFTRADTTPAPPATTLITEIGSPTGPADPSALINGLIADRTGDHTLTGELTRDVDGTPATIAIRRARLADRALDQIGETAAVVADGTTRQCEIDESGNVSCAAPQPTATLEQEAAAIRALFDGPDRSYDVFPTDDPLCWLLVAPNLAKTLPYGRTSEVCFDPSQRLVLSRDTNGRQGSESYRVITFAFDVSEADLEPG